MSSEMKTSRLGVLAVCSCLFLMGCVHKRAQVSTTPDPTGLGAYVSDAKNPAHASAYADGSLWVSSSSRSDLFRDFKARNINDVVTIRVVETTQADVSADSKRSKSSSASTGFDGLFGLQKRVKELPSLVSAKGSSSFEGSGSTTRATTLQTALTARVIDVLPNGYLVVEGMREVRVNNENQIVYLTGIVRPEDLSRDNVVASSSVAQMAVRVHGNGAVSQPLKPGWLFKIVSGILPF